MSRSNPILVPIYSLGNEEKGIRLEVANNLLEVRATMMKNFKPGC